MSTFEERLAAVQARIADACCKSGRDKKDVQLIAVSKTRSAEAIREAYATGLRIFAENYVQELVTKAAELSDLTDIQWRFIGHLQRNKVKKLDAIPNLQVDSVDSVRLLVAIANRTDEARPRRVLLQVNVAGETQKSGCRVEDLSALIALGSKEPRVRLEGLMMIAQQGTKDFGRTQFANTRQLAEGFGLATRSMGMSADMELAIEEGATEVRIGTALFGPRT